MELKPGYKQTEVGVIPEEWAVRGLGDIASVAAGGTPSRKNTTYWNGYIPWVTTSQIDFNAITKAEQFITDLGLKNSAAHVLRPGTLLLALYGQGKTRGKVGILGIQAATNQACASIEVFPTVSGAYTFHYLASRYEAIRSLSNSGSQDNLNGQIVKSIPIPLPPTKIEQEAIAEALSDADALIESLEQLIAKKRHLKQGAMQELLAGGKRLPGFTRGWAVKRLEEIAEIVMGQSPSSAHYNRKGNGLPLIQGNADVSGRVTIQRIFTTAITKRARCGDILMSVRAPVGEISRAVFDVCLGRGVCAIRYPNDFLYHSLIREEPSWVKLSKGSTFDSVNSADVKAFEIPIPSDTDEQTAIAAVLSEMDAEIAALEAKLAKARQIKQGMMHNLLTGRIRLV